MFNQNPSFLVAVLPSSCSLARETATHATLVPTSPRNAPLRKTVKRTCFSGYPEPIVPQSTPHHTQKYHPCGTIGTSPFPAGNSMKYPSVQGPKVTPGVAITTARELTAVALGVVRYTLRIASVTIPHHPKLPIHLSCRIMSMDTSLIDTRNGSRRPLFLYTLAPTPNVRLVLALVARSRQVSNPRSCTP